MVDSSDYWVPLDMVVVPESNFDIGSDSVVELELDLLPGIDWDYKAFERKVHGDHLVVLVLDLKGRVSLVC